MLDTGLAAAASDPGTLRTIGVAAEAVMLICFGSSWPFSVAKAIRVKKVSGKSPVFLWLILVGYCAGITFKLATWESAPERRWVIALYCWNLFIVGVDTVLYYRYRRNG